jgi:hypothetical protein
VADESSMADELERAREALQAGDLDEALVLLWKNLEPARLARDEETLAQIAALAQQIPGREADDLLKATGGRQVQSLCRPGSDQLPHLGQPSLAFSGSPSWSS